MTPIPTSASPRDLRLQRVRQLVMQYGWNATAYQLLNPGIHHWFSPRCEAVVGYVNWGKIRVVAGAPVCAEEELPQVVAEFERASAARGRRVCYFGAAGRLETLLNENPAYASVVLGSQPVWHPHEWAGIVDGRASLRAQINRARNKRIIVRERPAASAQNDPQLERVLREWLHTRGLPSLHFLVEPRTLARLLDRRIWVAERAGKVVAFLVMSPVPQRQGWLTEQFVRGRDAPNGTVELLMDTAIRALSIEGAQYVTMGLVPLSHLGRAEAQARNEPFWLRLMMHWVRAHGRRFYNFDGLEAFKSKFCPREWEPIWAFAREPSFSPTSLWAIAGAFSRQSPSTLIQRGLWRAVRQEWRWFQERRAL